MFQMEYDLVHRYPTLEDHSARIVQEIARHQTQNQVPVVGVFALHLTGFGRQQMLDDAEHLLNQVATRPGPKQPRHLDLSTQTQQIKTIVIGLVHQDDSDGPIGWTRRPKPHVA